MQQSLAPCRAALKVSRVDRDWGPQGGAPGGQFSPAAQTALGSEAAVCVGQNCKLASSLEYHSVLLPGARAEPLGFPP